MSETQELTGDALLLKEYARLDPQGFAGLLRESIRERKERLETAGLALRGVFGNDQEG